MVLRNTEEGVDLVKDAEVSVAVGSEVAEAVTGVVAVVATGVAAVAATGVVGAAIGEVAGVAADLAIEVAADLVIEVAAVDSGVVAVAMIRTVAAVSEVDVEEVVSITGDRGLAMIGETITKGVNPTDLENRGVTVTVKGGAAAVASGEVGVVLIERNHSMARSNKIKKLHLTIDDTNMYKGEG